MNPILSRLTNQFLRRNIQPRLSSRFFQQSVQNRSIHTPLTRTWAPSQLNPINPLNQQGLSRRFSTGFNTPLKGLKQVSEKVSENIAEVAKSIPKPSQGGTSSGSFRTSLTYVGVGAVATGVGYTLHEYQTMSEKIKGLEKELSSTLVPNSTDIKTKSVPEDKEKIKIAKEKQKILSLIDLTNLDVAASESQIIKLCEKAVKERVAGVCVNPNRVEVASRVLSKLNQEHATQVKLVSVVGGFPLAQTDLVSKLNEVKRVLAHGVDEIDMVLNLGLFRDGNVDACIKEIESIKHLASEKNVKLKVILETANLESSDEIKRASECAIKGGADFIKTSTGFGKGGADERAVIVMAKVIANHFEKTGKLVGLKPSGGIRNQEVATRLMKIVKDELGDVYLQAATFRIGASSLVDQLVSGKQSGSGY